MHGLGARWVRAGLAAAMLCLAGGAAMAQPAPQQNAIRQAPRAQIQAERVEVAPAPQPSEPAPVQAVVPANVEWAPTGVVVQNGGRLQIDAGQGRWAVSRQPVTAVARVDVAYTDANGFVGRTSPSALAPQANVGALIGKIGENGAPFLIGSKYDATATADGPLFLSINDAPGAFADNAGRMPVSMLAAAAPPAPETPAPNTPTPEQPPVAETPPPVTTAPPVVATPTQEVAPAAPALPPWLAPLAVIVGVLAVVALLSSALGQRAPNNERRGGAGAQITARLVSDGRAQQALSISAKGGRRA